MHFLEDTGADRHGRRNHRKLEFPGGRSPIHNVRQLAGRVGRIGHGHGVPLRIQKFAKPASHLSAATDHQGPMALSLATGAQPDSFLPR